MLLIPALALAAVGSVVAIRGCFLSPPSLSPEDRKRDIEYLAQWATDYSPFVDLNERIKGQPSHEKLKASYVELAKDAKDNTEFAQIAYCYASLIGASGHFYISKGSGRKWLAESRPEYWSRVFYQDCIVHPPFRLARDGNKYLTRTDYEQDGTLIPSGSQILAVNGITCQAFLEHVRNNTWVRVASGPTENLDRRLLLVNEGEHFKGWRVDFLRPDQVAVACAVPAQKGPSPFKNEFIDTSLDNCVCLVLSQSLGYIRIKTFGLDHVGPDREKNTNRSRE